MKKKNVLTMALSVSLVGVIAVGGTLAYLTSTTGPVTNTFTASDNIAMTLTETDVDDNGDPIEGASRVTSNDYKNIVPGVAYLKDPTVNLTKIPNGGVYVFARIVGLDKTLAGDGYTVTADVSNEWKNVTGEQGKDGIYVYVGEDHTTQDIVEDEGDLTDIFQHVTFTFEQDGSNSSTTKADIDNINVVAYAIQATGIEYSDAKTEATTTLNQVSFTQTGSASEGAGA